MSLGLAVDIVYYGSGAAGGILKYLGEQVIAVTQYRSAQAEAQAKKEQGERAH